MPNLPNLVQIAKNMFTRKDPAAEMIAKANAKNKQMANYVVQAAKTEGPAVAHDFTILTKVLPK